MSDPLTVAIEMEIDATLGLIERESFLDRGRAQDHLEKLVEKCIAYVKEPQEQPQQKRVVSFSDTCFHDPELMVDAVNHKVNMWLQEGGVIIRDPLFIPTQSVSISQDGRTVYFYTCSVVYIEDTQEIMEESDDE